MTLFLKLYLFTYSYTQISELRIILTSRLNGLSAILLPHFWNIMEFNLYSFSFQKVSPTQDITWNKHPTFKKVEFKVMF